MSAATDANIKLAVPAALVAQGFALRAETEADIPFLRRLYASTRWHELTPVADWSDDQKRVFLDNQFAFQRHHYRTHFRTAEFAVLERDGVPAGRLYIHRQADAVHVVDISLLPEWRGRGTGTALMQAVCAEAHAAGKKASIAVEKHNPAQRLYRRLGFRQVSDLGAYWTMEWSAAPGQDNQTIS
jgi:ribosomal protein S18 acetylase RimI-like enzyme